MFGTLDKSFIYSEHRSCLRLISEEHHELSSSNLKFRQPAGLVVVYQIGKSRTNSNSYYAAHKLLQHVKKSHQIIYQRRAHHFVSSLVFQSEQKLDKDNGGTDYMPLMKKRKENTDFRRENQNNNNKTAKINKMTALDSESL